MAFHVSAIHVVKYALYSDEQIKLLSTGLFVAFFPDKYTTSESRPANVCVSIIDGSIQRPHEPISLTLTTSPGSASRKSIDNNEIYN